MGPMCRLRRPRSKLAKWGTRPSLRLGVRDRRRPSPTMQTSGARGAARTPARGAEACGLPSIAASEP
eukprot:10338518-Alexandrium_andersonii.AAC.1